MHPAKVFNKRKPTTDHWMDFSVGSSACHIGVTQIQKRSAIGVELYINDDKELFKSLFVHKTEIESDMGMELDWRELPERKASRILVEKNVQLSNREEWQSGYLKAGDYFISAIELKPIEVKRLGKYRRMRRAFLQEYNPMLFNNLVLTEQLFPHLYEVQEIAEERVEVIMEGLLEKNSAPAKETAKNEKQQSGKFDILPIM